MDFENGCHGIVDCCQAVHLGKDDWKISIHGDEGIIELEFSIFGNACIRAARANEEELKHLSPPKEFLDGRKVPECFEEYTLQLH